jgi:hypothetical protein
MDLLILMGSVTLLGFFDFLNFRFVVLDTFGQKSIQGLIEASTQEATNPPNCRVNGYYTCLNCKTILLANFAASPSKGIFKRDDAESQSSKLDRAA